MLARDAEEAKAILLSKSSSDAASDNQGRAGAEFLTGHISVVGAQMKYEDEQSESTIDAVGRR